MNILYLTWGEIITNNGIFNNQVLEQLKKIRDIDDSISIKILSGMPLINRPLLRHRQTFLTDIERIRTELSDASIEFHYRWILVIARWFHSKFYHFPFYTLSQYKFMRKFITQYHIDIVHCRGYHAARLAILVKRKFGLEYKIVFDTRGLFPEEGVLAKHYSLNSRSYKKWKKLEKDILDASDAIVNVTNTFTEHIEAITANKNIQTIFTTTNFDIFHYDPMTRVNIRKQLSIEEEEKILVYAGSISRQGWHRISTLISLFQVFQQVFTQSRLLIITQSSHTTVINELNKTNLPATSYLIVSANSPAEVNTFLHAADYAALSYRPVSNSFEAVIARSVIASKTGEYFAVGLPLIVNEAVGAASKLVKKFRLGCTYKVGEEFAIQDCILEIDKHYNETQHQCILTAQKYFDATGNALKYIQIYKKLMGHSNGSS